MLLTVDIGNTNLLFGVFENDDLICKFRLSTDLHKTEEQYACEIDNISKLKSVKPKNINGAIISSVVPELTSRISGALHLLFKIAPIILGPGVKNGLPILIDNPAQLGADLVAGAVGAVDKYPRPCLIADLGTATKISVIDSHGAYIGCSITAGVGISLNALSGSAALLPSVNLSNPDCPSFGKNTVTSMQSGIIIGTAAMIDGMCDRIESEIDSPVKAIIMTGGYCEYISKYCKRNIICDPDLILYGLKSIYNKNKPKNI